MFEEEIDFYPQGPPTSHFELYILAVRECGADTALIQRLLAAVEVGNRIT